MRIAGYIEHPILKITIFQMENRFSVKLETPQFEQTYKFRRGPLTETVTDIRQLIDEAFIKQVLVNMQTMTKIKQNALERAHQASQADEDGFDEII